MPTPLPHTLSVPLKVTFVEASWQLRLVTVGSFIEYVDPDSVVFSDTEPLIQPVPVPVTSVTCSSVPSTLPVVASTSTVRRLTPFAPVPLTVVSQASFAVSPAITTSDVDSTPVTVLSCAFAVATAVLADTVAVVDSSPIGALCATDVYRVCPAASVTRTRSPPLTASPL